jgi:hypothetical protein
LSNEQLHSPKKEISRISYLPPSSAPSTDHVRVWLTALIGDTKVNPVVKLFGASFHFPSAEQLGVDTGVTTVRENLTVTLTFTSVSQCLRCVVDDSGAVYAQLFVTPPDGVETSVILITLGDLAPDGNCLGVHTTSRSSTPLGSTPGIYKIRFHGVNANVLYPDGFITQTPSVLIVADGNIVVKSPYPTFSGQGVADDAWQFSFEP